MFYHGCGSTENPNAQTDHSFWTYPCTKPTVNSWDTHLPVGLYCNNHLLVGSCIADMSLTEFECMGHESEANSAVVYTGALPLPLPPSRSVSPALSSASAVSVVAASASASAVAGRSVSPDRGCDCLDTATATTAAATADSADSEDSAEAEAEDSTEAGLADSYQTVDELASSIAYYKLSSFEEQQEQQEQQQQTNDKTVADLLDRIAKLEQRNQYNSLYRIVAELFAVLLLSLYFLKSTPHVATSSRDVDL